MVRLIDSITSRLRRWNSDSLLSTAKQSSSKSPPKRFSLDLGSRNKVNDGSESNRKSISLKLNNFRASLLRTNSSSNSISTNHSGDGSEYQLLEIDDDNASDTESELMNLDKFSPPFQTTSDEIDSLSSAQKEATVWTNLYRAEFTWAQNTINNLRKNSATVKQLNLPNSDISAVVSSALTKNDSTEKHKSTGTSSVINRGRPIQPKKIHDSYFFGQRLEWQERDRWPGLSKQG